MVTNAQTPIAELVEPPAMVADAREQASDLLRRFAAQQEFLTAIVVDEGRPVGLIRRPVLEREANAGRLVGQLSLEPLPPLVRDTMALGDVMGMSTPADLDRLPVVNAAGMLVGEISPTRLHATGGMVGNQAEIVTEKMGAEATVTVSVGEKVIGSDGHEIGTVKDVVMEMTTGRVGYLVIEEGLLFKKERRIPVDLVDPTHRDGDVHLKVDKADIDRLATLDDEREAQQ